MGSLFSVYYRIGRPANPYVVLAVGIVFCIVSVGFLGLSVYLFSGAVEKQKTWRQTTATVVRMEEEISTTDRHHGRHHTSKTTLYRPVFTFVPEGSDQTVEVKDSIASRPPAHKVGDVITVLYSPEHPGEACENSFKSLYFPSCTTCLLGGGGLIVGAVALAWTVCSLRRRKQECE